MKCSALFKLRLGTMATTSRRFVFSGYCSSHVFLTCCHCRGSIRVLELIRVFLEAQDLKPGIVQEPTSDTRLVVLKDFLYGLARNTMCISLQQRYAGMIPNGLVIKIVCCQLLGCSPSYACATGYSCRTQCFAVDLLKLTGHF